MKKIFTLGLLLTPFLLFSQQVARNLTAANGTFIGFYEYKPTDYDANPTTKYPLIIFLHGIGERGDGVWNLPLVLANGIPKNINQGHPMRFYWNGKWETFLVLSPQLSTAYGDWPNFYVEEMIKYAKNNMRIDTDRIILTGLSLGGGGVWRFASQSLGNAQQLAAIAPVCGTCAVSSACAMTGANLPVWAFHAQNDGVVGVGCTTSAITAINNCNPNIKPLMTIYPDGGHGIWDRAYDTNYGWQNINMYEWFLGQNKSLPVNILPTAKAGQDISITNQPGTLNLNGSSSIDPDGNIARYIWKKISGPSAGTINTPVSTDGLTTITGLTTVGTYVYELTVFDGRGGSSTDNVVVTVTQGSGGNNLAPVANAGTDQTISGSTATLSGHNSYDSDGSIVSWNWTKTSGPASHSFSNSQTASPTLSNLEAGTYEFTLTVTDNNGASSTDLVKLTVNTAALLNWSPIAKAGNDKSITLPTNNVNLDAYGSYDPDGTITSWSWTKISGPAQFTINSPQGITTSITGLAQGTYSFGLTVTDNIGAIANDTISIVVNAAVVPSPPPPSNQAPVANAGSNASITLPVNTVSLNANGSYDPDGAIVAYQWSKISGPNTYNASSLTNSSVTLTNMAQGAYSFQLQVTDNSGASAFAYVSITVNPAAVNQAPIALAGTDITVVLPTNSVTLDGSGSADPDGSISNYTWTQITGPSQSTINSPTTASTSVSNLVAGTYQFRLEVKDNGGISASDEVIVVVSNSTPNPPSGGYNQGPVANAGGNVTIALPTNTVQLSGTGSFDPDGSVVSYRWTQISGYNGFTSTNTNTAVATLSNLPAGVYGFMLTVVDNLGKMGFDYATVTVSNAPVSAAPIAKAGADIYLTLPLNSANLNGYNSYDPDGYIKEWSWTKISGPSGDQLATPASGSTLVSVTTDGVYSYKFIVTDNNGQVSTDTIVVYVVSAVAGQSLPRSTIPSVNAQIQEKLTTYPNPAVNSISLRVSTATNGKGKINILDINGRLVKSIEFTKIADYFDTQLDISSLTSGIYIAEVILDRKTRMISKFIKK